MIPLFMHFGVSLFVYVPVFVVLSNVPNHNCPYVIKKVQTCPLAKSYFAPTI
jgi:hypothetical protein